MQQAKFSPKNALNKIADFSVELLKNTINMSLNSINKTEYYYLTCFLAICACYGYAGSKREYLA